MSGELPLPNQLDLNKVPAGGTGSCYYNNTPINTTVFKGGKKNNSSNNRTNKSMVNDNKKNDNKKNDNNEPMMGGNHKNHMGGKKNDKNAPDMIEMGGGKHKVHTGPRGGKYIVRGGVKVYI